LGRGVPLHVLGGPREDLVVVYFTQLIPTGGVDDHAKLRTLVYQALDEMQ